MSKADNLLAVLWMLRSAGKPIAARQLAEALEISVRTVYRYIDALCMSGVPVLAEPGHGGGFRLPESFGQVPLIFDPDEQKALLHAAAFAREAGYPHGDALERAVAKLRRFAGEDALRRHVEGFDVILSSPGSGQAHTPLVRELEAAVAESRTVRVVYRKPSADGPRARHIDPYGLVYWKNRWYVVGWCHLRGEIRSFRADRMTEAARTERTFTRPEGFSAREFFMKGILPDPHGNQTVTVHIRGREEAMADLCGHWYFAHVLAERSGGDAWFRLDETAIRTYAPYFLLPYGKSIRVLEPARLRKRLAEIAAELAEHHLG